MEASRRRSSTKIDVWPGYVDTLAALLMLVIFLVLIFTLAQVFLSQAVSNRDQQLQELNAQLEEISTALLLKRAENERLSSELSVLQNSYQQGLLFQDALKEQVAELEANLEVEKETLSVKLQELAQLQQDIFTLREMRRQLENDIARMALTLRVQERTISGLENERVNQRQQIGQLRDRSKALQSRLAAQQDRTLLAQQEIERKDIRIQDLAAMVSEGKQALADEKRLSASAQANIRRLSQRIEELQNKLSVISEALRLEENKSSRQQAELADLGKRLNALLAERVNELEQYRSEFFGRLRKALISNPEIRIAGDRFLLPSELFFQSASATLDDDGKAELDKIARILTNIAADIPDGIKWILRVDGHTDKVPINTTRFPSNWELSTARAVSVVRYLAERGVPPSRMMAAGFGENHPVEEGNDPALFHRNRRIELKLTER